MPVWIASLGKPLAVGWQQLLRLRQLSRFLLVLGWIVSGFVLFCLLRLLLPWRPLDCSMQAFMPGWMRVARLLIGVRVSRAGAAPTASSLVLSNHISWLDVVVIGSVLPVRFVAKTEVRHWPLIGLLATSAGTLFLARGKRLGADSSEQVREQVQITLSAGDSVLIFPEGTTSDGRQVRRFHGRLLPASAELSPLALSYRGRGAVAVPFLGDDDFFSSLWRVVGETDLHAHLQFLPCLPAGQAGAAQAAIAVAIGATPENNTACSSERGAAAVLP